LIQQLYALPEHKASIVVICVCIYKERATEINSTEPIVTCKETDNSFKFMNVIPCFQEDIVCINLFVFSLVYIFLKAECKVKTSRNEYFFI